MPDYENDLAFKPDLSWEELCEYVKSKGAWISDGYFVFNYLSFYEDGDITFPDGYDGSYFIAREREYEQMKAVIDNLGNNESWRNEDE